MFTDADIEMAELAELGNMAAAGVCTLCEDVLDPLAPKWAKSKPPRLRRLDGTVADMTHAEWAASVGPHGGVVGGWHDLCARDALRDR